MNFSQEDQVPLSIKKQPELITDSFPKALKHDGFAEEDTFSENAKCDIFLKPVENTELNNLQSILKTMEY